MYRRGQTRPVHVYLPILDRRNGRAYTRASISCSTQLMTGKEALATRTLAKEGFQGTPNEESTSGELIAALSKS